VCENVKVSITIIIIVIVIVIIIEVIIIIIIIIITWIDCIGTSTPRTHQQAKQAASSCSLITRHTSGFLTLLRNCPTSSRLEMKIE
jgi:hypothetical protein